MFEIWMLILKQILIRVIIVFLYSWAMGYDDAETCTTHSDVRVKINFNLCTVLIYECCMNHEV